MKQDNILEMLAEAKFLKNEIGETKNAIKLCDKILKMDPDNRDAMLIKAGGLKESGEAEWTAPHLVDSQLRLFI
mgnify:CR=1 FL=1